VTLHWNRDKSSTDLVKGASKIQLSKEFAPKLGLMRERVSFTASRWNLIFSTYPKFAVNHPRLLP
jgi:hypothetical protein